MAIWNAHKRTWDVEPKIDGPIELYCPTEDGTEDLPVDSNDFEVEFYDEFETFQQAIDAINCCGRWMWSRPDEGKYLGALNSRRGSVEVW